MTFQRRSGGWRGNARPGGGGGGRGGGGRGTNRIRYMKVDPRMLVKKAESQVGREYEAKHAFTDFGLDPIVLQNVVNKGYKTPTPIQDQAIAPIMEGKDLVGLASTGTGKTAVFLLPIIHQAIKEFRQKAIIITPTRELAVQIMEEGRALARATRVQFTIVIGGVDIKRQIRELRRNPQVVVGTPGRIKDMTERGELRLFEYKTIVLDEVDRMLDMGFVNDITQIVGRLPKERHSLFFSATMSEKAKQIAGRFLQNPVTIQIETQRASDHVNQDVVHLNHRNKLEVLHDLLIRPGFDKVLVFGRTKYGMEKLSQVLTQRGFRTASIHGNKSQSQRQRALTAFKNNEVKVLLATDVAARGIDIDNVTHVINYELPETYDDYIHRIGRTGRVDQIGMALTFIE